MKINEVEALVGVTRKNIRFYEEQGLLSPRRNSENGYRDYGEAEVETLRRIKLMRKLGVPIQEIRQMQSGERTVADAMRRHLVTLEREKRNLDQAAALCEALKDREERLEALDAGELLEQMERLERAGATFQDTRRQDIRVRYIGPIAVTAVMVLLMAALSWLLIWAYLTDPSESPPLGVVAVLAALPVLVISGVLLALRQRLKEIGKGEADDAKQY